MQRNLRTGGFPLHGALAVARAAKDVWATIRRGSGSAGADVRHVGGLEALEGRQLMAATVLSGTGFGTAGSYGNLGNTYDKALDGNLNSYVDSTEATGAYVGLDLGSAKNVTAVQVAPRSGMGWRVTGAKIQGSNTSATSGFVDLGTISGSPADGQLTTVNLSNPGSYRWVRYVSPQDGFGNIAELKFLGGDSGSTTPTTPTNPTTPTAPTTPTTPTTSGQLSGTAFGTAGSFNNTGNTFDKAFDGNANTHFDSTQGTGAVVGLDLGSAQSLSSVKFMPRSGFGWRMTGGKFQGSNDNSNWTTLATIAGEPASGQYTTLNLSGSYRYVRYVPPADSYGNVAEVQFFGSGSTTGSTPQSPGTPVVSDPTPPPTTSTPSTNAPAPNAVITQMQGSVTAGMAVHVNALSSALNAGTAETARYEWDFGDPNGKYNKLVGFNAAHVYDTPGTYYVTLKVTNEGGGTSTTTSKVTVNADTRRTIYVDAVNGNDGNNGTSTSSAVRTAAKAFQMLGNDTKILFARGQTFGVNDFLYAIYSNITIGAYGSGANPVLQWQGPTDSWREIISASAAATKGMTVENLTFDSVSGTPVGVAPRGTNVTVRNCQFYRVSTAINCAGSPTGLLIQDNGAPTDGTVKSYFLWLQGNDSVILGNKVADGGMYAIRSSGIDGATNRSLIAYNELNHVTGSVNLRLQKGSYYYVANNTISGKGIDFGPNGGGLGYNDPNYQTVRTSWVVMENNTVRLGTGLIENDVKVSHGTEHVMLRNNIIFRDGEGEAISIDGYNASYQAGVSDLSIFNNTVVNNSSSGSFLKLVEAGQAGQISVQNNLFVAPKLAIGADGTAPVYVNANDLSSFRSIRDNVWSAGGSVNGWAAGGYNFVGTSYAYPSYVTPTAWNATVQADNDTFANVSISGNYTPSGVATAYSRPSLGVFTDFYGKARPAFSNWSAGAVQA